MELLLTYIDKLLDGRAIKKYGWTALQVLLMTVITVSIISIGLMITDTQFIQWVVSCVVLLILSNIAQDLIATPLVIKTLNHFKNYNFSVNIGI